MRDAYPEDQAGILSVPAVSGVVGEETPGVSVILFLHQNAHSAKLAGLILHVFLPDDGQEERTSRVHDRNVRQKPVAIILLQQLNHTKEERMLGDRSHSIVGDAGRNSATNPRRVGKQGIEATVATL